MDAQRAPKKADKNPHAGNRGGRPRRVLDADEIQRLISAGVPLREIARRLHAGYGTVYRMATRPQLIQNPATDVLRERPDCLGKRGGTDSPDNIPVASQSRCKIEG